MKLRTLLINILLSLISIYTPLLFFSSYGFFAAKTKTKFIEEQRKSNEDIPQKISALRSGYMPTYYPTPLFENKNKPKIYPVGSLPYTKSYLCNEGYGLVTYKTDRFGLRNSDEKWKIVNNQPTVFTLGDSFTHGACVPEDSTIAANIEVATELNTINLGAGANGPYEYLAILNSIVKPIINNSSKKNIVVIIFYANDNEMYDFKKENLLSKSRSIITNNFGEISPTVEYKNSISSFIKANYTQSSKEMIMNLEKQKKYNFKKTSFYQIGSLLPIRKQMKGLLSTLYKSQKASYELSERTISLLSEVCQNLCKPIVAYIPNSQIWKPDSGSTDYKKALKTISKRKGIDFVDGEDVINANNLKDYAPKGGHLSIDGYQKIGELISKGIKIKL